MCLQSYLNSNPETAKAFLRALKKGQDFVNDSDISSIVDAVSPSFPDSDRELLTAVVTRYKEIDVWNKDASMLKEDYQRLIEIIKDAGIIQTAPDFETITASEFW